VAVTLGSRVEPMSSTAIDIVDAARLIDVWNGGGQSPPQVVYT
jgi:hypothetical protein